MPGSSKSKRRDPRAGRSSSTRRADKRGPRKSHKVDEPQGPATLSSEDAAELEALTAPLRRYRAQSGGASATRTADAERTGSTRVAAADAADSGARKHDRTGGRKARGDEAAEGGGRERAGGRRARGVDADAAEGVGRVGGRGARRDADAAEGGGRRGDVDRGGSRERRGGRGGRFDRDAGRGARRRDDRRDDRGAGRSRARDGADPGGQERRPLGFGARPARGSLPQKGGEISTRGDEAVAAQLAAALRAADTEETNDLTHGFHTYPARMHPRLARELVARFSEPEDLVLDPFCGSGTVLVEALVAGRKPQGVDLNPLALRISEMHTALRDERARRRFQRLLRQVADASEERVRSRARAHIPIDRELQAFYQPHVLFELSGLREEIDAVPDETDRRALLIVFSALLIKFSRKRADTSGDVVDKRIRKGLVTEFFERKGQELSMRWEALFESAPEDAFEARLLCGDARDLPRLLGPSFQADLILTSPPYGGTYDYARQHQLRNAWFGFDTEHLQEGEIGARRALSRAPSGAARWNEELLDALRAMRQVASDSGDIILWLGDAEISGQRIRADEQVADLAPRAALALKASAAQPRFDARGGPDRLEHLLLLEPQPFPEREPRPRPSRQ